MRARHLAPVLLALVAASSWAQVQRCKDAGGKTYYSDRGCVGGGEKVRGDPAAGAHVIGTTAGDEEVARKCLDHVRGREGLGPAEALRVERYRVRTVAVRNVGPRRLFTIAVGYRDPLGYWEPGGQYECLLRGDNVTFQTTSYEIVN